MRRMHMSHPISMKNITQYGAVSQRGSQRTRALKMAIIGLLGASLMYAAHLLLRASATPLTYGMMIDAGSTGSRIHTFSFRANDLKLVNEDFLAIKPGLSSFVNDPPAAAKSLEPLLERARGIIPPPQRAEAPVFLRATAGLRAVGKQAAEHILDEVRSHLARSDFRFDGIPWASVMDGNDEGIFSWITVNYLLGRAPDATVGTLEMGGGSAQIAFVPSQASEPSCAVPTDSRKYASGSVNIFARSDLGFGMQKARQSALLDMESKKKLSSTPCMNAGAAVDVAVPFDDTGRSLSVSGNGDFARCREQIRASVIAPRRNDTCACSACAYDGKVRPKPIAEYIALAFYRERTVPLGMKSQLTVTDIRKKGEQVCAMSVNEVRRKFTNVPNGQPTDLCLDLAYIVEHLDAAYGITEESGTSLHMRDEIDNVQLGWSLGAMFYEMMHLRGGK